jgi:hypothetical protein
MRRQNSSTEATQKCLNHAQAKTNWLIGTGKSMRDLIALGKIILKRLK